MESEWDEGQWIANDIAERRRGGASWKEHMVLIRTRYAGRSIGVAFLAQNIPFVLIGGTSLFQSAHIRDVLSALRIVANICDEIAWVRYLTLWPGVGEVTAAEVIERLQEAQNVDACVAVLRRERRVPATACATLVEIAACTSPAHAFEIAVRHLSPALESNYRNQQWETRKLDFPHVAKLAGLHGSLLGFIEQYVLDPFTCRNSIAHSGMTASL